VLCISERPKVLSAQGCVNWYFWLHSQNGPFLRNHKLEPRVAMSLHTRVYNIVSEAEKHVPYVELIGTIVCLTQ
jgi:hypothetical protein